jgi:hypothetical protein
MKCQEYRRIVALRPLGRNVVLLEELTLWSKHEKIGAHRNRCSLLVHLHLIAANGETKTVSIQLRMYRKGSPKDYVTQTQTQMKDKYTNWVAMVGGMSESIIINGNLHDCGHA